MMDFTFETPAWELSLNALQAGSKLSAARFLTMMESESEEAFGDALQLLDDKDILLDVADIPACSGSGDTAVRLRHERQLARENMLLQGLEENDPLRLYLEELAATPVAGDPQILAEQCLQGDEGSRDRLMQVMLSAVIGHARALTGHSVLLSDLIQEGSLGVWQAILNYQGGDFESVCNRWICRCMARVIVTQARANGVGSKMRQALEDYRAVDERLLSDLGRNPTLEEIAAELHMTLQEAEAVAQMLEAARTVSRAKQETQEPEETPEDQMAVEDTAYFQMRQRIADMLSGLGERDAKLLTLRFGLEGGLPLSPEETGRKLGMTADEVVAAEAAALAKLRTN